MSKLFLAFLVCGQNKISSAFLTDRLSLKCVVIPEGNSEKEPVMELEKGQIYSQGNLTTFNKLLTKLTGKDEPRVSAQFVLNIKVRTVLP